MTPAELDIYRKNIKIELLMMVLETLCLEAHRQPITAAQLHHAMATLSDRYKSLVFPMYDAASSDMFAAESQAILEELTRHFLPLLKP